MFVSVVMPVYNGEKYVAEAVGSILTQTHADFEYIIVNDGSTDRTKEFLNSIADSRVKVIHLERNAGAANATNLAIGQARGGWIAVQDADDVSLPTRLEDQISYVRSNPGISAVGSLIECVSGPIPLSRERLLEEESTCNSYITSERIKGFSYFGNPICHGSLLFSKSMFHAVGGYDPSYRIAYDYDLWMRMIEVLPIEKVEKVLYQWRVNPDSLCRSNDLETCVEVMRVSTKHARQFKFGHLQGELRCMVIGPQVARDVFLHRVCPHSGLEVIVSAESDDDQALEGAFPLVASGAVDGVFVLDDANAPQVVGRLGEKGLEWNGNLFWLWNVIS